MKSEQKNNVDTRTASPAEQAVGECLRPDAKGLYVHVPFCETKCGYCDFFSVALKDRQTAPMTDAICRELAVRIPEPVPSIDTCFCGGGTPTLLPIDELKALLTDIASRTCPTRLIEWTVEANPATVDAGKVRLLRESGVTRVSLGAQSFLPTELAALERLHDPADITESVRILRDGGMTNLNLDLIFGIPNQTLASWRESLLRVIDLETDHVSAYGLTYEPRTRLTSLRQAGRVTPCDESLEADMFSLAMELLESHGFRQYELSNYARPGRECLHNLIYWRNGDYVGVGPSAAGCVGQSRYKNIDDIAGYVNAMRRDGRAEMESESLDRESRLIEMVMMQMRTSIGLDLRAIHAICGESTRAAVEVACGRLAELGHIERDGGFVRLTRAGKFVANHVIEQLVYAIDSEESTLPL